MADRIRQILSLEYWTQQRVAEELGVSQSTVNRWLKGSEPEGANRDALVQLYTRLFNVSDREPARSVPILSWVSAGQSAFVEGVEAAKDAPRILVADLPPGSYFALEVEGDSMDRIAVPGSIILVNRNEREMRDRHFYIVATPDHHVTFKRFREDPPRMEPYSTNPAHEPIYPGEGGFRVIGRVRKVITALD